MACCCQGHRGYLRCLRVRWGSGMHALFLFHLGLVQVGKGLDELNFLPVSRVLLLKYGVQLVLFLLGHACVLLNVNRVDKCFRVVHRTPAHHAPMVRKGRELVFLDVLVHRFLNIEVIAGHFCNLPL